MTKPIEILPGCYTLAEAMEAEGIFQIRFWRSARLFTVQMDDGRTGQGETLRAAIANASHERLAA